MADAQTDDPAEARARAFFEDTVGALKEAHVEGWDTERTNAELTGVQRAHGYWTDTPVLGGSLGVDVGVASAGVTVDANKAVGVEGTISLPATRDLGRDLDAANIDGKSPVSVNVGRELFGQAALNTDNNLRGGVQFTFSAKVDTTSRSGRTVRGGVEGFVNAATDGSVQMGVSGSAVPGLLRGRIPVEVGVGVTSDMIDTEMLVKDRIELFEQTITEANDQGFAGETWARDSIYNVLEETGGGNIPESRLVFSAGVAEFEAKYGGQDRAEALNVSLDKGSTSRLGLNRLGYKITQAGENEGFYRVEGNSTFSDTTSPHGLHQQGFDAIIDGSGRVIDGYELEHREGGAQNYHTVSDGAFGSKSPWSGQLDHRMDPREFGPAGFTNENRQYARMEYERDKTVGLDALEDTDLAAAYPESAAKHGEARWSQDRAERVEEAANDAARWKDYQSEQNEAASETASQTPLPDTELQQTPVPAQERNFTPMPDEIAPPAHEAAPTSYAAPSLRELLSGPDFAWSKPDYLPELAGGDGNVPFVNWPSAGAGVGMMGKLRGMMTPDPPGLSLRELSQELHETGRAVNALDAEQNGMAHSSPEGWRLGHPETHARWDALAKGVRDGGLEDMRVEVNLTDAAGNALAPHARADALSDAVDRASAAQAQVTGRVPQALSGPTRDYSHEHPVPGSEEALLARDDDGALARDAERGMAREAQREAALEDLLQRPTTEQDYAVDQEIAYDIDP